MTGPIIAGTDGSDLGALAIEEAGVLASRYRRPVMVVFVRPTPVLYDGLYAVPRTDQTCPTKSLGAREVLVAAQAITMLDSLDVSWTVRVRHGRPANELMRTAAENESTMIVVARRRLDSCRIPRYSVTGRLITRWHKSLLIMCPSSQHLPAGASQERPCVDERHGLWFNRASFDR
jgi:nucleotide-binding universal stress UspA family protein